QNLYNEVLVAFDFLQNNANFRTRPNTYADLISACSSLRSLQLGRKVHDHILSSKCQPDVVLHNHILNMYGKCGSLEDARMVFDEMPLRNVGAMPDQFTFGSIIRSISGLCCVGLGRQLYAHVIKSEHRSHLISQNALIAMYTKFDRILDAWNVFSGIARKDITSWDALSRFNEMLHHWAYQPNEFIFGSVFSACSSLLHHECGRQIHGICIKFGLGRDIFAGCSLCDMYAQCGLLDSARIVFNEIESPDLASWNAIIARVARAGCMHEADDFINQMAFDADIVWEEVARLRGSMKERGVRKVPGQSWIEIQSKINVFFAEDVMHPERDKIYTILEELWLQMLDEGYVSIHMLASTEQLQWSNKLPPHYSTK
ncbi:hypothetical protein CICLE_v10013849mg, partial [Citrus x clementina]